MPEVVDQRALWEEQHARRSSEHQQLIDVPSNFAKIGALYLPDTGIVLEIGAGNGRDARFLANGSRIVYASDFSTNAIAQTNDANKVLGADGRVIPVLADAKDLPLKDIGVPFDAVYARSSLHLSDDELENTFTLIYQYLKDGGYIMVEGKNDSDPKMLRSQQISPNLLVDEVGHIRRLWVQRNIEELQHKFGFRILEIVNETETIVTETANFTYFIAKKK